MAAIATATSPSRFLSWKPCPENSDPELDATHLALMFHSLKPKIATSLPDEEDLAGMRADLAKQGFSAEELAKDLAEDFASLCKFSPFSKAEAEDTRTLCTDLIRSFLSCSSKCAITHLGHDTSWKKGPIPEVSVRVWFDGNTDLPELQNSEKEDSKSHYEAVITQPPVIALRERITDPEDLPGQLGKVQKVVLEKFEEIVQKFLIPGRVLLEWRIDCPEAHIHKRALSSKIPLMGEPCSIFLQDDRVVHKTAFGLGS